MHQQVTINLGNLLLSMSDALDLASPQLALHQQRTAFICWEMCKYMKIGKKETERIFIAALLHDIGALSLEEKIALRRNETDKTEPHCIRGKLLFENIPWLQEAAPLIRNHHSPLNQWKETIDASIVHEPQIILLGDTIERSIDRDNYILHQENEIREKVKGLSGEYVQEDIIDAFMGVSKREEFWLDLVSPRIYSLLLHNGPYRTVTTELPDILIITELFKNIIDFKSRFTATHSSGVAECAACLAKIFGFTETEIKLMEIAGHLHDLGKLSIPNAILEKPDKLSANEFMTIKQHTYYTYSILSTINGFQQIAEWGAYHHERLDGRGYPFHKTDKELNVGCRIMGVADIFTALAEDRPYREAMKEDRINKILTDMANNGVLDKRIVTTLLDNASEIKKSIKEKQDVAKQEYDKKFNNYL